MNITVNELTEEEQLALVSLLKAVVRADRQISAQEHSQTRHLALEMGAEQFAARIAESKQRLPSLADIKAHAATIERPEAQELIFERLLLLAEQDGLALEEESLLGWLQKLWRLG